MNMVIENGVCFALIVCTFFSCKKETYKTRYDELLPRNNGTMSGFLNGSEWKSDIYVASYFRSAENSDTVDFTARIFKNGYEIQQLSIGRINLLSSIQEIQSMIRYDSIGNKFHYVEPTACYSTFFPMDVDVPENAYWVYENENTNNHVKIEVYNSDIKKVKGSFEVHYVRVSKDGPLTQGLPDTLHFTNGKFEFQLK